MVNPGNGWHGHIKHGSERNHGAATLVQNALRALQGEGLVLDRNRCRPAIG